MARKVQIEKIEDFTGGLNLVTNQFKLAPNETPDCLNVEIDPRGGFKRRRGSIQMHNTDLPAQPRALHSYATTSGIEQVLCSSNGLVYYSTGGDWTSTGHGGGVRCRMATFNDKLYAVGNPLGTMRWDGSTKTILGQAFADDYGAPTGGNSIAANYVCAHAGRLWIASTTESSTAHPNRVRFSHPNRAEDWRTQDFIEIDIGHDGDIIVGLASFGDRLLVFKRKSVHIIYGTDDTNFSVETLTDAAGADSQDAIVVAPSAVFFWSWPDGVFTYSGSQVAYLFTRLDPAMRDGRIVNDAEGVCMAWAERKLFVGIPWVEGGVPTRRTLVFDPTSGDAGAWVMWDSQPLSMLWWRRVDGSASLLACVKQVASEHQVRVWLQPVDYDQFYGVISSETADILMEGDGYLLLENGFRLVLENNTPAAAVKHVAIPARLTTRWIHAELPEGKKKYHRPRIILNGDSGTSVKGTVRTDFDSSRIHKQFIQKLPGGASKQWGAFVFGDGTKYAASFDTFSIEKGPVLGSLYAVQLEFATDTPLRNWAFNSIALPYEMKKVR